MAREGRFTLFGFDTPEQVRARIGRTIGQNAQAAAGMAPGRGQVSLASTIGQMIPHLFLDTKEEKLAESRSSAMQNAFERSKGKPTEYYKYLAENLSTVGDQQGAIQALEQFRGIRSQQAAAEFAERELAVKEKRIDERTRMQSEKLELAKENLQLEAELGRAKAEVDRLVNLSQIDINNQKVKNMQASIEEMETKMAQNAEKLRQADEKLDIYRDREATRKFDAQTRRMKVKADERLDKMKLMGKESKSRAKLIDKSFDDYSRVTQKKDFLKFAKTLVEDDPELGSFFSDVDEDVMANLIRGEVQQAIGEARIRGDENFRYNDAVIQAVYDAAQKYTQQGENIIGIERPEPKLEEPRTVGGYEILEVN